MVERFATQLNDIEAVQNPAVGGVIIWKFGLAFQQESGDRAPSLPLLFVVLPICFHRQSLDLVHGTQRRSGLSQFAAKLGNKSEELFAVQIRMLAFKSLTLMSIGLGIQSGLFSVNYEFATVRSNTLRQPSYPERIRGLMGGAEKLGEWAARLPIDQFALMLKLEF